MQQHVFLQCHPNVMQIVMFAIWELICMDVGWEISANQMTILVHQFVTTLCQHNVKEIARYVKYDFIPVLFQLKHPGL